MGLFCKFSTYMYFELQLGNGISDKGETLLDITSACDLYLWKFEVCSVVLILPKVSKNGYRYPFFPFGPLFSETMKHSSTKFYI